MIYVVHGLGACGVPVHAGVGDLYRPWLPVKDRRDTPSGAT